MRFFIYGAVMAVCAGILPAQTSPELTRAQQNITRMQQLVDAGAVAPSRLQEAQQALADAQDDAILHRTLYGKLTVQDLTEEQSKEMVAAAQRRLDRQKEKMDRQQKLVDSGVMARGEMQSVVDDLENRKLTVDLANSRARLLDEIVEMARRERDAEAAAALHAPSSTGAVMERFDGDGSFTTADLKDVENAFEHQFKRPLPISAMGETNVHRALGFDHRGRVDVAVLPDQPEGIWLRAYLEKKDIPYYAFRAPVAGKATGAHIHMGPGSTRLRAAD